MTEHFMNISDAGCLRYHSNLLGVCIFKIRVTNFIDTHDYRLN